MMSEFPNSDPVEAIRESMRASLRESLTMLHRRLEDQELDPKKISPTTVKDYVRATYQLETDKLNVTDFSPADQLEILRRLEQWFVDRSLEFPNLAWLARERARYQQT